MDKAPCDCGVKKPENMTWRERVDYFNPPSLVKKWRRIVD